MADSRRYGLIALLAVVAAGAAFIVKTDTRGSFATRLLSADEAARASTIVIARGDSAITLTRAENGWVMPEKSAFPVRTEKVSNLLDALKTAPLRDDSAARDAASGAFAPGDLIQLSVRTAEGTTVVDHELGTPVSTPGGQNLVKRPARARDQPETAALLDGRIKLAGDAMDWLERSLINLPRSRMLAVETGTADQRLAIRRPDPLAPQFERVDGGDASFGGSRSLTLADVAGGLENIMLEDVRPADASAAAPAAEARFETIDGLIVSVALRREGDATWARFDTAVTPPAAAPPEAAADAVPGTGTRAAGAARPWTDVLAEAAALKKQLDGREFRLPERAAARLAATADDIVR